MSRYQPTDEWIEDKAGVTDEVAKFIFTSKLSIASRACELYDRLRTNFEFEDMDEFKSVVLRIKSIIVEEKLNSGSQ